MGAYSSFDPVEEDAPTQKHEPLLLKPLEVTVVEGKIEKAIRKLKKKMAAEGVLKELKRRRRAIKPSDQKRKKRVEAARRLRKRARTAERRMR